MTQMAQTVAHQPQGPNKGKQGHTPAKRAPTNVPRFLRLYNTAALFIHGPSKKMAPCSILLTKGGAGLAGRWKARLRLRRRHSKVTKCRLNLKAHPKGRRLLKGSGALSALKPFLPSFAPMLTIIRRTETMSRKIPTRRWKSNR